MVAYSYKGRFVAPVRVGLGLPVLSIHRELGGYHPEQPIKPKRHTIRAIGKRRHARPGETLQHYHGMRSPKCFKIGDARCTSISAIHLFIRSDKVVINPNCDHEVVYSARVNVKHLDAFAGHDGFADWAEMKAFWLEEHDGKRLGPFCGVLVKWEPL